VKARVLITMLALTAVLAVVSGCDTDNNERQAVVCEVQLTNAGVPIISAAINTANPTDPLDDFVPIDTALFTFRARPYLTSTVTGVDAPYSWFHITGYDLVWTPLNSAPDSLTTYNMVGGGLDMIVPLDDDVTASIIIVEPAMKQELWYPDPLGSTTYTARLTVNFKGHASGSQFEVTVPTSMTVTFLPAISDE